MKVLRNLASIIILSMLFFSLIGNAPSALGATATTASADISVTSTNGYPISSGHVTAASSALPFPVTVSTDTYGTASFPNLPPGEYTITASAIGFDDIAPIQTGMLSVGQAFNQTIQLAPNISLKGIDYFNVSNNSSDVTQFAGYVSWSTFGPIPDNSEMKLQFMDSANNPISFVADPVSYSAGTSYYSLTLQQIQIPSGAARIGITVMDGSSVIGKRTMPLWNNTLHSTRSLTFHDYNAAGNSIDPAITWTGAEDEDSLAGYNVYYWVTGDNTWKYWDTVAKRPDKTYQYDAFDTLPANTGAFLIGSLNSAGEEVPSYPTVYVIDNRQADTALSAPYSATLPAPFNIQNSTYSLIPNTLSGQIDFTLPADQSAIQGYNLYFANSNGDKIQAIGTLYTPRVLPWLSYVLDANQPIPSGATQFALYSYGKDGSESSPVHLAFIKQLPSNLKFVDMDEQPNKLHGFLTWTKAQDESALSSYSIYFLGDNNQQVSLIGEVPKGLAAEFTLPWEQPIPSTATHIGIFVKDTAGNLSAECTTILIADHATSDEVKAGIRAAYLPVTSQSNIGNIVTFFNNLTNQDSYDKKDVELFLAALRPVVVQQ